MTSNEIVALRCPSCGEGITQPSREMPFGAEFRCEACDITSVLIVNRDLVPLSTLQKLGEKVCTACGRVAQREARFCQEGHALVRGCIKCDRLIAVDYQRCDFCGWLQSVTPGTAEWDAINFDRAVSELNEVGRAEDAWNRIEYPLKEIVEKAHKVSQPAVKAAVSAILNFIPNLIHQGHETSVVLHIWPSLIELGPKVLDPADRKVVVPILHQAIERRISQDRGWDSIGFHWSDLDYLKVISPEDIVPLLRRNIEKSWPKGWSYFGPGVRFLGTISPEDALAYWSRGLEEWDGNGSRENERILQNAFALGKAAIPMLEKFCGLFSGRRGKACAKVISALREGKEFVILLSDGGGSLC